MSFKEDFIYDISKIDDLDGKLKRIKEVRKKVNKIIDEQEEELRKTIRWCPYCMKSHRANLFGLRLIDKGEFTEQYVVCPLGHSIKTGCFIDGVKMLYDMSDV